MYRYNLETEYLDRGLAEKDVTNEGKLVTLIASEERLDRGRGGRSALRKECHRRLELTC